MAPLLDRRQPLHFIGVGGIGMSALAGILAQRGFSVSGSDPRDHAVLAQLRRQGVRVFRQQNAGTIDAIRSGTSMAPLVVISTAVPDGNPELAAARRAGLTVCHRSDVLAGLINGQPSIAVAGSHGKTTTSSLIATLLAAAQLDPTAVIGGIVPAFGSNGRHGEGRLLVAEADESDGSLVKFSPTLGVLTNLELDHTDHYPDLKALIATMKRFSGRCERLLANRDCPVLREYFRPDHWWSTQEVRDTSFAAVPISCRGDGTVADFLEQGRSVGTLTIPLPGQHNLSNVTAAVAACRLEGVPFAELQQAVSRLQAPGRRFDYRGSWCDRLVVDDYAHHPSEVAATLELARLMVRSRTSTLPQTPRRVLAVFQPHRYSRTGQFMQGFAQALSGADAVLLAPLYSAGEQPLSGVSSEALAAAIAVYRPTLEIRTAASNDELTEMVAARSRPGDLVLAMGAGDINGLWERLNRLSQRDCETGPLPLAA